MTGSAGAARPRTGVLVGPGVLANVAGLHALAAAVGVAVINTWGAKGIFRWDDPFHGGTAGLQERDFELAGLGDVDVLITAGLDRDEVRRQPWLPHAEVIEVPVPDLARFAASWPHPPSAPTRPDLYTRLAELVQPMYRDPASVAARLHEINQRLPDDGVVFAAPGLLGFWVARTWSTTVAGSVVVPASTAPGLTQRLAVEAARAGRSAVLLSDRRCEVEGVEVIVFDQDLDIPQPMVDLAGPLVAWT